MDDYSVDSLSESKTEWCARLVSIFVPAIVEGLNSIFQEAVELCTASEEDQKYLMTFQTFLKRVPSWNPNIIEIERRRIEDDSNCKYLEDLVTCVHVIQLKSLTCIRVASEQKKVDIEIPSLDDFVHKVYINVASRVYTNVYLFQKDVEPLQTQRNQRELEILLREAIMQTIRDTMPIEKILRSYMEKTEEEVTLPTPAEKATPTAPPGASSSSSAHNSPPIKKTNFDTKDPTSPVAVAKLQPEPLATTMPDELKIAAPSLSLPKAVMPPPVVATPTTVAPRLASPTAGQRISFDDTDYAVSTEGKQEKIVAPKDIPVLEKISEVRSQQRKLDEEEDGELSLKIGEEVKLAIGAINEVGKPRTVTPQLEVETLV